MSQKSIKGRDTKRLGVHLPRELHTWLKVQAASQETTIAALVEKVLWNYYAEVTQEETEEKSPSLIG